MGWNQDPKATTTESNIHVVCRRFLGRRLERTPGRTEKITAALVSHVHTVVRRYVDKHDNNRAEVMSEEK